MKRCINIDWLEVFCVAAPDYYDLTPGYFRECGWQVIVRDYGTPQYVMMFTLFAGGFPVFEIRRLPHKTREQGGVLPVGAMHIRLANRTCYRRNPIGLLRRFLIRHHITYMGITRIDVCLDFEHFDTGGNVQKFIRNYVGGKYSKINQTNLSAHGLDMWDGRFWNSLSWGVRSSMVSTKLYNKTLELKQRGDKPYIRQVWQRAGLIESSDWVDRDIWRLEFSVKGEARKWVPVDRVPGDRMGRTVRDKRHVVIDNTLSCYDTPERVAWVFWNLCNRYFHFKHVEYMPDGSLKRKDRCADKVLFRPALSDTYAQVTRQTSETPLRGADTITLRRLSDIEFDVDAPVWAREAAADGIEYILHQHRDRYEQIIASISRYRRHST